MSVTLNRGRRTARTGVFAARSHIGTPSAVPSHSPRTSVHWLLMYTDAHARRSALAKEHGAITRLITIIALGALLLLGVVALNHGDNAPVSGVVATASDTAPHDPAAPVATSIVEASVYDVSPGMALCVLGVVCGFVLYLVVHLLVRRGPAGITLVWRALPPSLIHPVSGRPEGHALTIAQLGISRT